jgi:hypothetical protein
VRAANGATPNVGQPNTQVQEDAMRDSHVTLEQFPTATTGVQAAHSPNSFELADGERFDLRIAPVTKLFDGKPV